MKTKSPFQAFVVLFDWQGVKLGTTVEALTRNAALEKFRREYGGVKVVACY